MFVCFCNLFRYSSFYRNIIIIIILKLPGLQLFLLLSWFGFRETGKKLIYVCCQPYTKKNLLTVCKSITDSLTVRVK